MRETHLGSFQGCRGSGYVLAHLRVRFGEFRNHFNFWSQLRAGSDLEKLGGHLGGICLEVGMGAWVTFEESLWESFGRWMFILVIYSINFSAGIRFWGE